MAAPRKKDEAAGILLVATNRKANHLYKITDTVEAGIALAGTEVKSLRLKRCSMVDAHARVDNHGNMELFNFHINPYEFGNRWNLEATRPRRLLLHRKQIRKMSQELAQKGMAFVPMKVYFKRGKAKVLLGIGKGKDFKDKREAVKEKQANREGQRSLRANSR